MCVCVEEDIIFNVSMCVCSECACVHAYVQDESYVCVEEDI